MSKNPHAYQRFSLNLHGFPNESTVNRQLSKVHSMSRQLAKVTPENSQFLNVTPMSVAVLNSAQYQLHPLNVLSVIRPSGPGPSKCRPSNPQYLTTPASQPLGGLVWVSNSELSMSMLSTCRTKFDIVGVCRC